MIYIGDIMKKYNLFIFNLVYVVSMEILFKLFTFKNIFSTSTITMLLFSIAISLILSLIETMFKNTLIKYTIFSFFSKFKFLIHIRKTTKGIKSNNIGIIFINITDIIESKKPNTWAP